MKRTLIFLAALWAVIVASAGVALAQMAFGGDAFAGVVDEFCANHGAVIRWALGALGTTTAASIIANVESKLPPSARAVIHVLALNFFAIVKQAADQAAQQAPVPVSKSGPGGPPASS